MIVLLHVLIALSSMAYTGYVYLSPSKAKLNASYGLVAATIGSGTYLVWTTHAPMLEACVTGLVYLGIVLVGIAAAHHKLATEKVQ